VRQINGRLFKAMEKLFKAMTIEKLRNNLVGYTNGYE